MAESELNWKKVFKKILLKDNFESDEISVEANSELKCTNTTFNSESADEKPLKEAGTLFDIDTIEFETFEAEHVNVLECSQNLQARNNEFKDKQLNQAIPEWKTVFKTILGGNHSEETISESSGSSILQSLNTSSLEDHGRHHVKKVYRKTKQTFAKPKKQTEDEKCIKELLDLSRTFKQEETQYKLNEFDGSGVNVFKCSRSNKNKNFAQGCSDFNKSVDRNDNDYQMLLDKPLMGVIAVRPYTKQDLELSGCITVSELWDEDLYY